MNYKLVYKSEESTYLIGIYPTKETAEKRKNLLCDVTQEYKEEELEVLKNDDTGK